MIAECIVTSCRTYYGLVCNCYKFQRATKRTGYGTEARIEFIFRDDSSITIDMDSKVDGYFEFSDSTGTPSYGFMKPLFNK